MSQTIELAITGMTCDHCVHAVTEAIQDVLGVESVKVDLASNAALVTAMNADIEKILAAVAEEGYTAAVK